MVLFSGFSNNKSLEERELLQKLNKIEEKIDFNYNVLNKHLVRMMAYGVKVKEGYVDGIRQAVECTDKNKGNMSKKSNHLLELVMFDIAYVISNCDYEYSSDEKKYLNIILNRYDEDDRELLKLRTQFLDSILEKGIDEVKSFVTNLSKSLKNKIDDDMKDAYLALFKEVIMLDENVHNNEKVLYQMLCEQWGRQSGL